MAKNEFKNLNRLDLVEIIYRLQENEDKLNEQIESLKRENTELRAELERRTNILNKRERIDKEAGSIAQEIVAMSGIFEKAQQVADRYVLEIKKLKELAQEELIHAKAEKADVIEKAKRLAQAERISKAKSAEKQGKVLTHEEAFAQRLADSLIRESKSKKAEEQ